MRPLTGMLGPGWAREVRVRAPDGQGPGSYALWACDLA